LQSEEEKKERKNWQNEKSFFKGKKKFKRDVIQIGFGSFYGEENSDGDLSKNNRIISFQCSK
jgi:hypothetical protein